MTITVLGSYKIISDETKDYDDIALKLDVLLSDLGVDQSLISMFKIQIEDLLEDALSVSFITAYKDYINPNSYSGVSLVKWTTPKPDEICLAPSDFCVPIFVATKEGYSDTEGVADTIEMFVHFEAQSRQSVHEFREQFKL